MTKVAAAITDRTRVIMPVHLGGAVADLDTIMAAAAARDIRAVEDACQSHLACPQNDRLCSQAVWFPQTTLLGPRQDMDHITQAIGRIQKHAGDIARLS